MLCCHFYGYFCYDILDIIPPFNPNMFYLKDCVSITLKRPKKETHILLWNAAQQ